MAGVDWGGALSSLRFHPTYVVLYTDDKLTEQAVHCAVCFELLDNCIWHCVWCKVPIGWSSADGSIVVVHCVVVVWKLNNGIQWLEGGPSVAVFGTAMGNQPAKHTPQQDKIAVVIPALVSPLRVESVNHRSQQIPMTTERGTAH